MSFQSDIYERMLKGCEPYCFPGRWTFLTPDPDTRSGPSNPSHLLADLCAEFPVDDLILAGVARTLEDGSLAFADVLTDATCGILIAIRDVETGRAVELLTSTGCLSGRVPLFAALDDCFFHSAGDDEYVQLLLAGKIEDVALLRACGIPATLTVGMEAFGPRECDQLRAMTGAAVDWSNAEELPQEQTTENAATESPVSDTSEDPDRQSGQEASGGCDSCPSKPAASPTQENGSVAQAGAAIDETASAEESEGPEQPKESASREWALAFVYWSPSALGQDISSEMKMMPRHVARLSQFLDLNPFAFGFWQPDERRIERLSFWAEHQDFTRFREELVKSCDQMGSHSQFDGSSRPERYPPSYQQAVAHVHALRCGAKRAFDFDETERAEANMERRWHEEVQHPLIEEAMREMDPNARLRQLMVVELSKTFHAQAARVNSTLTRSSKDCPADPSGSPTGQEIRQLLEICKQLIALMPETSA